MFPALMCDDGGYQRDGVFVFSFPGADDSFPAAALERKSESHERETMLSPGQHLNIIHQGHYFSFYSE